MNDFIKKHSGRAGETGQIWSDTDERLDSETRLYGTLPISGRHERERERDGHKITSCFLGIVINRYSECLIPNHLT